jgi:trimethylamine--corrinoid protein Co-methyltransferase
MAYRMISGISQRDEPIALDLYPEDGSEIEFLTHPHTLQWHVLEQRYPHVINRDGYDQWVQSGKLTAADRASARVTELLGNSAVAVVSEDVQRELKAIMQSHAMSLGVGLRS